MFIYNRVILNKIQKIATEWLIPITLLAFMKTAMALFIVQHLQKMQ